MNKPPPSILDPDRTAFDIDGVVVDIVTPLLLRLDQKHGYPGFTPGDVTSPDLSAVLGIPSRIVEDVVLEMMNYTVEAGAQPYPGAAPVLERISRTSGLLFITSRPSPEPIERWFKEYLPNLPRDRYTIAAVGRSERKVECLLDHGREVFFDDFLDNCRMVADAGLCAYVFDRPWNQGDPSLPRVRSWEEILTLFDTGAPAS